jgi:hypothetical protein
MSDWNKCLKPLAESSSELLLRPMTKTNLSYNEFSAMLTNSSTTNSFMHFSMAVILLRIIYKTPLSK